MNEEFETGVRLQKRVLPCCSSQKTLAELKYEWPQAFGLFSLSVMNDAIDALPKRTDRKSTRLNSSHLVISYAVFCLKEIRDYAHTDPLHVYSSRSVDSTKAQPTSDGRDVRLLS